jgi:hypothetical protein
VTVNEPQSPVDDGPLVVWPAVLRGALLGLSVLAGASVIEAILDHNVDSFNDSGWIYPLFVMILVGYALGGWLAGRLAPDGFLSNGALAGLGALVLWIPVRIVIWLVRDENRGLFSGHSPALRPGQVFGQLLIAATLGMFGGFLGSRPAARTRRGTAPEAKR